MLRKKPNVLNNWEQQELTLNKTNVIDFVGKKFMQEILMLVNVGINQILVELISALQVDMKSPKIMKEILVEHRCGRILMNEPDENI